MSGCLNLNFQLYCFEFWENDLKPYCKNVICGNLLCTETVSQCTSVAHNINSSLNHVLFEYLCISKPIEKKSEAWKNTFYFQHDIRWQIHLLFHNWILSALNLEKCSNCQELPKECSRSSLKLKKLWKVGLEPVLQRHNCSKKIHDRYFRKMSFLPDVILSNLYSTQDGFLELQSEEQLLHHTSTVHGKFIEFYCMPQHRKVFHVTWFLENRSLLFRWPRCLRGRT